MENTPENSGELKRFKAGDTVFLTDAGMRKLLVRGFTFKDFSISDPLEVVEVIEHSPEDIVYMVKISRAENAVVDFDSTEIGNITE